VPQNLKGLKVLFLVAPAGVPDDEIARPRKILEAGGAEVAFASLSAGPVTTQAGAKIEAAGIVELRPTDFAGAIVPGGPGAADLASNGIALKFVRMVAHDGKPVGALSQGVVFLAKSDLLEGKSATTWVTPDALRALKDGGARFEKKPVVVSGGIVTCDGAGSAESFGNIYAEILDGSRTRSGRITR